MTRYILRRLLASAMVVLVVTVVIFLLIHATSGDVLLAKLKQRIPPAQMQALRHQIGLDQPLYRQYLTWFWNLLHGDLGKSMFRDQVTVWRRIRDAFPVTLELTIFAMVSSMIISIPIGVLSAARQNTLIDHLARFFSITGLAMPLFWLGTLVLVYGGKWFSYSPPTVYEQFWHSPLHNLRQIWLPGLILGYNLSSISMRITRSAVLEILRQDYVRTAFAKGLAERVVLIRHVLKNAIIPILTVLGNQVVFLLGGTLIVEFLFHVPGLGFSAVEALSTRDYTMIQGLVFFLALIIIAINLLIDISYARLDPRLRVGG